MASTAGYCQEISDENKIKVLAGEVVSIDTVGSTVVVRWFGWNNGLSYYQTTFSVSSSTKIVKGRGMISFLDLNQFDYVIIRYTESGALFPVAISILIDNSM